jgi:hypothetical protein
MILSQAMSDTHLPTLQNQVSNIIRLKETAYAAQQTVPTLKEGLLRLFGQRTSCSQNRFYLTL